MNVSFEDYDTNEAYQLFYIYQKSLETNWRITEENGDSLDYNGTVFKFYSDKTFKYSLYLYMC